MRDYRAAEHSITLRRIEGLALSRAEGPAPSSVEGLLIKYNGLARRHRPLGLVKGDFELMS